MLTIRTISCALAALLLAGCANTPLAVAASGAEPVAEAEGAARELDRLADEAWEWVLETDSTLRDAAGLPFVGIKDITLEETRKDAAYAATRLSRLDAIPSQLLDPDRELTRQFLVKFYSDIVQGPDNWLLDFSITPYSGVLPLSGLFEFATKRPLDTHEQRDEYLFLLEEIAARLAQMESRTRAQEAAGILLPQPAIGSLRATYSALAASTPKRLVPDAARLEPLPPEEREAFADKARAIANGPIAQGLERMVDLLGEDYIARAPAGIGLAQYPGGPERYRRAIATYTTLDVAPEQLHERGLALVVETQARLAAIRREVGFSGTQAEFHAMLNSDARFRVADVAALEALYREQIARIEPQVPKYFSCLPRAGYDIRRIPEASEGGVAFGYYEKPSSVEPKGLFRYNAANLDRRSMVQAAAINFHELIPGHHFHLALQAENQNLPTIRREYATLRLTGYNEGWAQYGANLAVEMGAVTDPYERYGLVATDAMMAARLVVDTGVNSLGWDVDRARDYLVDHTMMTPDQASAEVLRYATDVPGQALGYKLGHERIETLRRRAEAALGEDFDIRAFHETALAPGALPLDVLEGHVDRWITSVIAARD